MQGTFHRTVTRTNNRTKDADDRPGSPQHDCGVKPDICSQSLKKTRPFRYPCTHSAFQVPRWMNLALISRYLWSGQILSKFLYSSGLNLTMNRFSTCCICRLDSVLYTADFIGVASESRNWHIDWIWKISCARRKERVDCMTKKARQDRYHNNCVTYFGSILTRVLRKDPQVDP